MRMVRRGILFTDDDEQVIDKLKDKLHPTQGPLTLTAVVRLAIRKLLKDLR